MARTTRVDDTRETLLEAALEVFLEKGYDGTRVADIARRGGLSTGAIYGNFENKSKLLSDALLAKGLGKLAMVSELGTDPTPRSVFDRLAGILGAEPDLGHRLSLELFAAAPRDTDVGRDLNENLDAADQFIEDRLQRARAEGRVDDEISIEAYRYVVQLMVLGSIVVKGLGRPTPPKEELRTVLRKLMTGAERAGRRRR